MFVCVNLFDASSCCACCWVLHRHALCRSVATSRSPHTHLAHPLYSHKRQAHLAVSQGAAWPSFGQLLALPSKTSSLPPSLPPSHPSLRPPNRAQPQRPALLKMPPRTRRQTSRNNLAVPLLLVGVQLLLPSTAAFFLPSLLHSPSLPPLLASGRSSSSRPQSQPEEQQQQQSPPPPPPPAISADLPLSSSNPPDRSSSFLSSAAVARLERLPDDTTERVEVVRVPDYKGASLAVYVLLPSFPSSLPRPSSFLPFLRCCCSLTAPA